MNAVLKSQVQPSTSATIEKLALDWLEAKARETAANGARIAIESEIAKLVNDGKVTGTSSSDAGDFVVKVERKLNRKIDLDKLREIVQTMPEHITERLLRTKLEVDVSELKWLQENDWNNYLLASKAIIETPAKPAVKVVPAKSTNA